MKNRRNPAHFLQDEWLITLLTALIPGTLLLGAAGMAIYHAIPQPTEAFLTEIRSLVVPQAVGYLRPEPRESGTYIALCLLAFPAAFASLFLIRKIPVGARRFLAGCAGILLLAGFLRSGSWLEIAAPLRQPIGWAVWGGLSLGCAWLLYSKIRISEKILQILLFLLLAVEVFSSRFYTSIWINQNLGNEHISIVTYAIDRAVQGVPEVHLYGFYPQFLAPVFHLTGLTLGNFSMIMAVLYLIVMIFLMDAARSWIRQAFFFGGASILLLMMMNWHDFLQRTGELVIEPYYSYFPLRLIFPVAGLFWLLNTRRDWRCAAVAGGIAALGLWFTPDTGLALTGAGLIFFLCGIFHRDFRKEALCESGIYCGTFLLMLPASALLLRLISGAWPPVWEYLCYFREFQRIGYFMLPMEDLFGFWMVVALIYLGAMISGIRLLMRNGGSRTGRMMLFLAVLGCGLLLYYVGRSHPFNLLTCSWPAVLLYFAFAARIWRGVQRKKLAKFWLILLIPAILLPAGALGTIGIRCDRIVKGISMTADSFVNETAFAEFCWKVNETAGEDGKVILISYGQGALHLESETHSALRGFNLPELIFERDYQRVAQELLASDAPIVLVGRHWFTTRLYSELLPRYYETLSQYDGLFRILIRKDQIRKFDAAR